MRRLYEREVETEALDDALAGLALGAGRFVLVEAGAGLGKTSLLTYAQVRVSSEPVLVLRARAAAQEQEFDYGIVGQLFAPIFRSSDVQSRTALLSGAASEAGVIILPGISDQTVPSHLRSPNPHHQLHSLYWACANLAEQQPLLIVVDDVQWCDPASVRFLAYMARRIEDLPVVLVVAARTVLGSVGRDSWSDLREVEPACRLTPKPMTAGGVAALIEDTWGASPDPVLVQACTTATGGNPYYLVELTKELSSLGLGPDASAAARVQQTTPESVARSVAVRLARLRPSAQRAAAALAVLGDGAAESDLSVVSGLSLSDLADTLDALRTAGLIAPGRPLAFVHPIVGSACYEQVDRPTRNDLHRQAAGYLAAKAAPPEQVGLHLTHLPSIGDPWVAERLYDAAYAATARGALAASIDFLERCLAEPAPVELAEEAQRLLGLCELDLGRPQGLDRLLRYVEICKDPQLAVSIVLDVAPVLALQGRPEAALSLLDSVTPGQATAAAPLLPLLEHERKSLLKLSPTWQGSGELEPPPPPGGPSDRRSSRMAQAEYGLNLVLHCQNAAAAADAALSSIAGGWALDSMLDLTGFGQALFTLICTDRAPEALAAIRASLIEARARGRMWLLFPLYAWRIVGDLRVGDLQAAERAAHTTLMLTDGQDPSSQVITIAHLLPVLAEMGRFQEADAHLTSRGLDGNLPPGLWFDFLIDGRISIRAAEGRWDDVVKDAEYLAARAHQGIAASPSLTSYRTHLAMARMMNGDQNEALRIANQTSTLATSIGASSSIGIALRTQGRIEGGPTGINTLRHAVKVLETSPARLEYLRAQVWLGAALRHEGHRAEARALLRHGHAAAQSIGAEPLAAEASEEFKIAGGRSLNPGSPDGLTAAEQRIAQAAQEGLTNQQIAQDLFLSKKTVEMHLTRIYRKRGITKRSDLSKRPQRP